MRRMATSLWGMLLLVALDALAQPNTTVEVFSDKGKAFIRAGSDQGLTVGMSVAIVGEKMDSAGQRRTVGTATIMEVWPAMSRVSLDDAARAAQGKKLARIVSVGEPSRVPAADPWVAFAGDGGAEVLKGHAALAGAGPEIAHKMVIYNDDARPWTNCELRLPDNKRYLLRRLRAGDSETIMLFHFDQDGPAYDRPIDSVMVRCSEGWARLTFTM
jgi:eukaryotic-like serine/threonine-protein kinase